MGQSQVIDVVGTPESKRLEGENGEGGEAGADVMDATDVTDVTDVNDGTMEKPARGTVGRRGC